MAIKDRIKQLRQEKGMTQAELAKKVGIHQKQISAYERGKTIPSTEILIKFADIFDVSLDFLAFAGNGVSQKTTIKDRELMRRLEELEKLSEKDRRTILEVLDTFILKTRFQELAVDKN